MWALHSPRAPLLLKVTVVVTGQRQDGKGTRGAGLLESGLGRSPHGSPTLRFVQTPMTNSDSQESQLKAGGQVFQTQGPSFPFCDVNACARYLGPPADTQDTEGAMLVMRFPDAGES